MQDLEQQYQKNLKLPKNLKSHRWSKIMETMTMPNPSHNLNLDLKWKLEDQHHLNDNHNHSIDKIMMILKTILSQIIHKQTILSEDLLSLNTKMMFMKTIYIINFNWFIFLNIYFYVQIFLVYYK